MANSKGQALILVLLSMSVVLTIVLFILSRSITDIAVSTSQEDAVRAFSAAEAGIERALVIGTGTGATTIGDASYSTTVSDYSQGESFYQYPLSMNSGDSATVWLVEHDSDGQTVCDASNPCFTGSSMKICWGKPGTANNSTTTPAIETIVFYESTPQDPTTIKIKRDAFDPNTGRRASNNFKGVDSGNCVINGVSYEFTKTISFASMGIPVGVYSSQGGLQYVRIRMFYNTNSGQDMGVDVNLPGNTLLPSQGQKIISTGTSGESNRRVELFQGWPEVPKALEFSVYSSTSLIK